MANFFSRQVGQLPHFPNIVGERFFLIQMFTALHRRPGGMKMNVIRRGDHDRIDLVFHRVEHHAEIVEESRFGEFIEHLPRFFHHVTVIDIGDGHDIFVQHIADVVRSLAAEPDNCDVKFFIRRSRPGGR